MCVSHTHCISPYHPTCPRLDVPRRSSKVRSSMIQHRGTSRIVKMARLATVANATMCILTVLISPLPTAAHRSLGASNAINASGSYGYITDVKEQLEALRSFQKPLNSLFPLKKMKLLAVLLAVVAVASATQVINGRAAGTLCNLCVNFVTEVETAVKDDVPDIEKVGVFSLEQTNRNSRRSILLHDTITAIY